MQKGAILKIKHTILSKTGPREPPYCVFLSHRKSAAVVVVKEDADWTTSQEDASALDSVKVNQLDATLLLGETLNGPPPATTRFFFVFF